jgi:hypothetical protein
MKEASHRKRSLDDEARPVRRSSRKKNKGSNAFLIRCLVGVGLLLVGVFVLTAFVWPGFLRSGQSGGGGGGQEIAGNPLGANAVGPGNAPAQSHIRRGAEALVDKGLLKNIALACVQYGAFNNGRCPGTKEELIAEIKTFGPKFVQAIKEDWLIFVPRAPLDSNHIILYEKHMFELRQNRLVAFGDGHIDMMNEVDFQAAKKAQGF